ncbi:MAG: DNA polymerase/3'-5' exonuclease PolX [Actinobacteria bacterium]|nr:MAG: DNA polymerase/3'-5' exonuclease PolX [Actinomycetota bacterium]
MWLPMIAVVAKALPRNAAVAEQLELLSDILELEGEAAYRLLAYRRAAALVREQSGLVAELALEGKAKDLPGIGKTIEGKIVEIVNEGEIRALTKHKALVPPDVVKFTQLPGLGPKTARKIWQELGVTTLTDLKAAAKAERLRLLPGIGAKLEERIVKELSGRRKAPEAVRPLLGAGLPAVQAVVAVLREHPAALEVSEAGSVRRRKETFRDLDIIATATEPGELTEYFTKLRWVEKVAARGESKATVVSNDGLRFDLRVVPSGLYGNLLQHFTGSKHHNVALREDAVRRGLSISENGVKDVESGEVFKTGSEQEVYEFLGYQYIPPELRENLGELEAARQGELPALVELGDLRGDLHAHSSWSSDGKNTIEEMAAEAKSRGYSYLAVTDHSHYLREGRLEAQDREIEALNERLGRFRLLKGIEVNIRADGTLDVDDETLARRDWVVASLHTAFDKNPTERVVAAMENPHVDCIGHLTARKINRRGPADIDLGRVFETALATNTFLEINSQPDRLDLRDAHARAAGEAGVLLSISSDAHSTRALAYPELGVGQARRAWLTKEQVLNTRTWPQIEKLLR